MPDLPARDRWVERVLGARLPRPAPAGSTVAFRTLLLRWRSAQAAVAANLETIGKELLARDDVRADPRFAEVQAAVATLPNLVPTFGGRLEDALDAGINAGPGGDAARFAADSVRAIDAYRGQLDAAPVLGALEAFAANDLGKGLALRQALLDALAELKQELANVA